MFQQTFKNFNINLFALNERNTYSSGDQITGQISFVLTKDTKINNIVMKLRGKEKVEFSSNKDGGQRRQGRHHLVKIELFNVKSIIVQENGAIRRPTKLQPGTQVYPFTGQLPEGNFPSSFRGVHGEIVYSMTVSISRPWHTTQDFVTEFNFVNHIDANHPSLLVPLAGSNNMTLCCLWCASGPISMTVRLERKGFVPGETVKIICEFSNASSRTVTPKASLSQKQMFYANDRNNQKRHMKPLVSVTGQPLSSHSSDVYSEMMLTIPPTTPLTISNCSIIEVDYVIQVSLCVRGSDELIVIFPITMCDIPVYTAPPPYQGFSGMEEFPAPPEEVLTSAEGKSPAPK